MPLFTTLTIDRICDEIDGASEHVILAAPGICMAVANALQRANQRLGTGGVQVVLDVSARVARLGYGEHEGVEILRKAGVNLLQHAGLRIGALICDHVGWSFVTAPRLVEEDPTADGEAFNAITLTSAQVLILRGELPPVGKEENPAPVLEYPVVGTEQVDAGLLFKVNLALKIAPPQSFDLARQTQVYAALIQFVELKFEGFNIQSRRIQLPSTLPLISTRDKELRSRVTASLKVFDKIETPKLLKEVTYKLDELRNAYLIPVGHAGRVILKSKRESFEDELEAIEVLLTACKEELKVELKAALAKVVEAIVPDLARAVLANPPPRFRGRFPDTESSAADYVREELFRAFPSADDLVAGMKIHKFFKDVTYETLKDEDFADRVMREIPQSVLDGSLLRENMAVDAGAATS